MNLQRATEIVDSFAGKRVAVVGDLMLDRYIWGSASRISQEAPVPIVAVGRRDAAPGGAANVLRNLASLGARPLAFGVIGNDAPGDELIEILRNQSIDVSGVIQDDARITTQKTRVIADHQQVVRVDSERVEAVTDDQVDRLVAQLESSADAAAIDAIVLEDYAKGMVSRHTLERVTAFGNNRGIPIALDPHPSNREHVEGITILTPNRAEAFAMAGHYHRPGILPIEDDEALLTVVDALKGWWRAEYLLITLGADGMALFQDGEPPHHIPTQAREVFDVSGAGDTVIASFVLAHLAGASGDESVMIANHAAGVVVGKVGTAPVTAEGLRHAFENEE